MSRTRHAQSAAMRMPGGTSAASMPGSSGANGGVTSSACVVSGAAGSGVRREEAAAALSVTVPPYAATRRFRGTDPSPHGRKRASRRHDLASSGLTGPSPRPRGAGRAAYARGMSDTAAADRPTLAVTGSTGWLGGLVARDLAERGVAQRLLVREVGRAPDLPGAVSVQAAYADRPAAEAALAGAETLFMVSGAEN